MACERPMTCFDRFICPLTANTASASIDTESPVTPGEISDEDFDVDMDIAVCARISEISQRHELSPFNACTAATRRGVRLCAWDQDQCVRNASKAAGSVQALIGARRRSSSDVQSDGLTVEAERAILLERVHKPQAARYARKWLMQRFETDLLELADEPVFIAYSDILTDDNRNRIREEFHALHGTALRHITFAWLNDSKPMTTGLRDLLKAAKETHPALFTEPERDRIIEHFKETKPKA